jgi:hypothetical protein
MPRFGAAASAGIVDKSVIALLSMRHGSDGTLLA